MFSLTDFEADQRRQMDEQLSAFETQLQDEEESEQKRNEKAILALNARKEALLKEKKAKVKQEIEKMSKQGASKDEQEALLKEHSKDLAKLMNKMDADRMRMQSSLEERLKKKREQKRKAKMKEISENMEENKREFMEVQQAEQERAQAEEVCFYSITIKNILSLFSITVSTLVLLLQSDDEIMFNYYV